MATKRGTHFYIGIKKNTKVSTQGPAKPVFWPFESLAIKQTKTIVAPVWFSGHKLHLAGVKLAPDDVIIGRLSLRNLWPWLGGETLFVGAQKARF